MESQRARKKIQKFLATPFRCLVCLMFALHQTLMYQTKNSLALHFKSLITLTHGIYLNSQAHKNLDFWCIYSFSFGKNALEINVLLNQSWTFEEGLVHIDNWDIRIDLAILIWDDNVKRTENRRNLTGNSLLDGRQWPTSLKGSGIQNSWRSMTPPTNEK